MSDITADTTYRAQGASCTVFRGLSPYRRLTQIAFVALLFAAPALDILRYDSYSQELIVVGQTWSLGLREGFYADHTASGAAHVAVNFFLKAVLPWVVALSIFPLLGSMLGRSFCGWFCPEGAMFEFVDFLSLKLAGRRSLYGKKPNDPDTRQGSRLLYGAVALVSATAIPLTAGVALTGYFIPPKAIWQQMQTFTFTFGVKAGVIGVSTYMLITSLLVRHTFCKYICAAGLMQTLFGWVSPVSLRLKLDTARIQECTDCKQCEKVCFMDVVPRRNKRDVSCVNCGACIDACNKELDGRGLFHYSMGEGTCLGPAENCKITSVHSAAGSQ